MASDYGPIGHSYPPLPIGWSASFQKSWDSLGKSWPHIALKVGMTTAAHPFDLAKTLIQIGFEPIPPKQSKSLSPFSFGKPVLSLPSVFVYTGHIRKRDGFLGLTRGLGPKLVTMGVSALVSDQFAQHWPKSALEDIDEEELSEEQKQQKAIDAVIKEVMERFTIIVVTQPLHVVTIRAMASFVGQENDYGNILSGLATIYKENGILGFWSGMMPRALGEALTVALGAGFAYVIKMYADKNLKSYANHIASYMASSLCYPFTVVSHCSIVSRSGLTAGYPPIMPFYGNWVDIWRTLSRENQLKRGGSLLFRTYTGPQVTINNRVIPVNPRMSAAKDL